MLTCGHASSDNGVDVLDFVQCCAFRVGMLRSSVLLFDVMNLSGSLTKLYLD